MVRKRSPWIPGSCHVGNLKYFEVIPFPNSILAHFSPNNNSLIILRAIPTFTNNNIWTISNPNCKNSWGVVLIGEKRCLTQSQSFFNDSKVEVGQIRSPIRLSRASSKAKTPKNKSQTWRWLQKFSKIKSEEKRFNRGECSYVGD